MEARIRDHWHAKAKTQIINSDPGGNKSGSTSIIFINHDTKPISTKI